MEPELSFISHGRAVKLMFLQGREHLPLHSQSASFQYWSFIISFIFQPTLNPGWCWLDMESMIVEHHHSWQKWLLCCEHWSFSLPNTTKRNASDTNWRHKCQQWLLSGENNLSHWCSFTHNESYRQCNCSAGQRETPWYYNVLSLEIKSCPLGLQEPASKMTVGR